MDRLERRQAVAELLARRSGGERQHAASLAIPRNQSPVPLISRPRSGSGVHLPRRQYSLASRMQVELRSASVMT